MAMVDGGELFGRALANEGIEKAFVLCGGHIMPIFYGMRKAGIEIIDMHHECAAMYAAIAYTRASGKMAAVVTTAGPGVGNTPAGMMDAESNYIPVLHIGGAVAMNKRDAGDLQDMSTLNLMESCSKWARKITSTNRIPEYVAMAARNAQDSSPGPVYLEIPTNLVQAKVDEEKVVFPQNYRALSIPRGDSVLIEQAAALLAGAQRPAMIIDDGARASMGLDATAIAELSDYLKMPVGVTGLSCRGMFGDESENALLNTNAIDSADVVISLGCKFDFRFASGVQIPNDAKVIQVHTDMRQIGFNVRADLGIVGGAGPVTRQVLDSVKSMRNPKADSSWVGEAGPGGSARLPAEYSDSKSPTHPARCAGDVSRFIEKHARDWNVVIDGGEASVWMHDAATAFHPGQIQAQAMGPNGTIGAGPAIAVGAWAANRKPVLLYTGDGSFSFYPMELETLARFGVPVVCVIANNSGWGMIAMAEKYARPKEYESEGQCNVELPHMVGYEKMAAMWGGYGEKVTDPEEIGPAIERAAANGKPSIVNVEVDDVSLSRFIAGYATMLKPS